MRIIYRLMKTELKVMFYSPIAWIILIIFTVQVSLCFTGLLQGQVLTQTLGYSVNNVTYLLFSSVQGVFPEIQNYLYLYIPLLTMGLMSRELSSGSIRLLNSSPVTDFQIIVGKYLAVVVYAFLLVLVVSCFVLFAWFTVKDFDYRVAWMGVAGIFLLACTYGAIGLFMSVLTSYQVVAAMGSLVLLTLLNYIGRVGQNIDIVRDITYWLSVPKRISGMIDGLLCSKDLIYFPLVMVLFITLSILKLKGSRKHGVTLRQIGKYAGVIMLALLLGYVSSRPRLIYYKDLTYTGRNTLSKQSQEVLEKIPDRLTITTYVNLLDENSWLGMPEYRNYDLEVFQNYVRFKPDTKLKYVYYYDKTSNQALEEKYPGLTDRQKAEKLIKINGYHRDWFLTPEEIRQKIDLSPEGNRMVRVIEREKGQRTFLRMFGDSRKQPDELEITAAMKRLTEKPPKVGFLTGHGERSIISSSDRNYGYLASNPFRQSLMNRGFDVVETEISENHGIPEDIDILVIADPVKAFSTEEKEKLATYMADGRNLFIAMEPENLSCIKELIADLGIHVATGYLKQKHESWDAEMIVGEVTPAAAEKSEGWKNLREKNQYVVFQGAVPMSITNDRGFEVVPLITAAGLNAPLVVGLSRYAGHKKQAVVIAADADFMSTGEISRSYNGLACANFSAVTEIFSGLCDHRFPVQLSWPVAVDNRIYLSMDVLWWIKLLFLGVLPAGLLIGFVFLWRYRQAR